MHNPIRRYACYTVARLVDLLFPCTDPRDAPTVRLHWRYRVRRRRRVFPEDVPSGWVSDRQLTTAERVDSRRENPFSLEPASLFR